MSEKQDTYERITNRVIAALKEGTVPWHKPWKSLGAPRNLQSKRPYRGINVFILMLSPYSSPFWTTYKKASEMGGQVRKGEKGTTVVFWKRLEVDDRDNPGEKKTIPLLRGYTVFNAEQIDWNDEAQAKIDKLHAEAKQIDFEPVEEAQRVIDEMQNAPEIMHNGSGASYNWRDDVVSLPKQETFESVESYYSTAYHELSHSTGHEKRIGRIKDWSLFGSDPYAKEELVAEMTAAFLCGAAGIEGDFDQSAAYIANWLKKFQGDPKLVVNAAAQAQKAADYILNETFEGASSEAPKDEKELVKA